MSQWIGELDLETVIAEFAAAEVALAPVYDVAQYVADPQVQAREAVVRVDDQRLGTVAMQNVLFKMSQTPGAIRHTGRSLGADTNALLHEELEISHEKLNELRQDGVIA
jgi:crotonobetainyl-CoA:carnitine CoA-transferase CaiB-like acyl-CoA transferase